MDEQFNTPTVEEPIYTTEITADDKLWVLLAYVFSPLVPIIIMLMEDKKNRPFIRAHNAQALVIGAVNVIAGTFLSFTIVLACLPVVIWGYLIYLGIQGYNGKYNVIPVVTDFCKKQGWA